MEKITKPIEAGEPVRYYAVLKIAENRKHTKFHYKRRTFLDDEDAIRFARSRLRGGCVSASVYMYDPVVTRYPPEVFESTSAQRDARDILRLLPDTKIFYASRTMAMDLRDVVKGCGGHEPKKRYRRVSVLQTCLAVSQDRAHFNGSIAALDMSIHPSDCNRASTDKMRAVMEMRIGAILRKRSSISFLKILSFWNFQSSRALFPMGVM